LLTGKLNSKVSNGPWLGPEGKRSGLEAHDVLVLNRQLLKTSVIAWTEDSIRIRTKELAVVIAQIWPVPPNHKSSVTSVQPRHRKKIDLPDLINGGALQPGMSLFPRRKKYSHKVATLLPDGQVEVDGVTFSNASDAANAIVGKRTNGWWFFLTDQASRQSLRRVRDDYVSAMAVDVDVDEPDDDDDEDEE
jgi:Restriction Enzyme Adenine Methylase Associated